MATPGWQYSQISVLLTVAAGTALRQRVPVDPDAPVDGDARSARIAVRSGASGAPPIGCLFVRWDASSGAATVHRIGWDAANGGSELAVRRALAQLRCASDD